MKAHESTLVFWPRRGIYLLSNFGLFLPDRVINLFSSNLFISDFCLSGQRWIIGILLSLIRHMHILIFWIWLIIKCKIYRPMFIWRLPLRFFFRQAEFDYLRFFVNKYLTLVRIFPFPPHEWILYPVRISTSVKQCGCNELLSKLIIFYEVELFFSCVRNVLRVLPFEWAYLTLVGINGIETGYCCGLSLRGKVGVTNCINPQ